MSSEKRRLLVKIRKIGWVVLQKDSGSEHFFYRNGEIIHAHFSTTKDGIKFSALKNAGLGYLIRVQRISDGSIVAEYSMGDRLFSTGVFKVNKVELLFICLFNGHNNSLVINFGSHTSELFPNLERAFQ